MAARYRVLIADPLLKMGLQWPPGVKLAEQLERGETGTHWWLLDDPDAPEDLEGRQVELVLRRGEDGAPVIAERRVAVTHQCPPEDGLMPCCGRTMDEAGRWDRMAEDKELVTCGGA